MMGITPEMMDFVLKMMDFILKMMDFLLKVMDFLLKVNDLTKAMDKGGKVLETARAAKGIQDEARDQMKAYFAAVRFTIDFHCFATVLGLSWVYFGSILSLF